jgi:septum site-determining protein MinC
LLVSAGHLPPAGMQDAVVAALVGQEQFFSGSRIALDVGSVRLGKAQLQAMLHALEGSGMTLWAVLSTRLETREAARTLGLGTRLSGSQTDLEGNRLADDGLKALDTRPVAPESAPPNALLVRETLRSGRSIYHDGDIVVLGDVNPGSEIIAAGHVIVWGRLRGLVHAGAHGDGTAIVCALDLSPTQMRIGDQIAVTPAGRRGRRAEPEQAFIQDGQIVAELWDAAGR